MWNDYDGADTPDLPPVQQETLQQLLRKALQALPVDTMPLHSALRAGADPSRPVFGGHQPLLPLHVAIEKNAREALELLVTYGADVNAVAADGETALDKAIRAHSETAIDFLRGFGGKTRQELDDDRGYIYSWQDKMNAQLVSVYRDLGDKHELARRWLAQGADPDAQDMNHYSMLHRAVLQLDIKMIGILLEAGADIHRRSGAGWSPLDLLWHCHYKKLFTPDWYATLVFLEEKGCRDLFFRKPEDMTLEDMRRPAPGGKDRNFLDIFADAGRFDIVLEMLKRDPAARLTAEDFLKEKSYRYRLIDVLRGKNPFEKNYLWENVFTPEIWQGRIGEMTAVWERISTFHDKKDQERFAQAQRSIIDYQHQVLKAKRPRFVLKKGLQP